MLKVKTCGVALLLALGVALSAGIGSAAARAPADAGNAETAEEAGAGDVSEGMQEVEVGFYPLNIYDLDMSANTFYADFYVWFIWEGDRDPTENVEFTNNVEQWGTMITPSYDEPQELPDGRYLQELRVEGRFFNTFNLERYPFDKHNVTITLEDNELGTDAFVYVPSDETIRVDDPYKLVGWKLNRYNIITGEHVYHTQFGDTRESARSSEFSRLEFQMEISRSLSYFIWKLFLPLIVVLILSWGSLLVSAEKTDARTNLVGMSLLTIMFLQQMYSDALPELGYMTVLDKIYAMSYFLMVIILLSMLYTTRLVKRFNEAPEVIAKVARYDLALVVVQVIVFIVGCVIFML